MQVFHSLSDGISNSDKQKLKGIHHQSSLRNAQTGREHRER